MTNTVTIRTIESQVMSFENVRDPYHGSHMNKKHMGAICEQITFPMFESHMGHIFILYQLHLIPTPYGIFNN